MLVKCLIFAKETPLVRNHILLEIQNTSEQLFNTICEKITKNKKELKLPSRVPLSQIKSSDISLAYRFRGLFYGEINQNINALNDLNNAILPEDIEKQLGKVKTKIADLTSQNLALEKEHDDKVKLLDEVNIKINSANVELSRVEFLFNSIQKDLSDREVKLSNKESALDVYANALKEKEKKIAKYLAVFDNMKDVISK